MTFGNNDCKFHNDGPHSAEKEDFYNFMYDIWFKQYPANMKFQSKELE